MLLAFFFLFFFFLLLLSCLVMRLPFHSEVYRCDISCRATIKNQALLTDNEISKRKVPSLRVISWGRDGGTQHSQTCNKTCSLSNFCLNKTHIYKWIEVVTLPCLCS